MQKREYSEQVRIAARKRKTAEKPITLKRIKNSFRDLSLSRSFL